MGVYNTSFISPYALFAQQFKEVSINRLLEFRLTKTSPMHEDKHRTSWNKPYVQGKRFYICPAKGEGRMSITKRRIDAKNAVGQISLPDTVATSLAIRERNPVLTLDMEWLGKYHINLTGVERRTSR